MGVATCLSNPRTQMKLTNRLTYYWMASVSISIAIASLTGASLVFSRYVAAGHQSSYFGVLFEICLAASFSGSAISSVAISLIAGSLQKRTEVSLLDQCLKKKYQDLIRSGDTETAAVILSQIIEE